MTPATMTPATIDAACTDHALAFDLLAADPQFHRIEDHRRDAMIASALASGVASADDVRRRHGNDPDAIAAALGIPVEVSATPADYGSTLVFAEYQSRPPRIVLFPDAIARVDACLADAAMRAHWRIASARSVYVAHELFHHLDADAIAHLPAHRVTLFALGRWRWTAGVAALSEIAAGAFAQRLLGLPAHPRALDLLAAARPVTPSREHLPRAAVGAPSAEAVG